MTTKPPTAPTRRRPPPNRYTYVVSWTGVAYAANPAKVPKLLMGRPDLRPDAYTVAVTSASTLEIRTYIAPVVTGKYTVIMLLPEWMTDGRVELFYGWVTGCATPLDAAKRAQANLSASYEDTEPNDFEVMTVYEGHLISVLDRHELTAMEVDDGE